MKFSQQFILKQYFADPTVVKYERVNEKVQLYFYLIFHCEMNKLKNEWVEWSFIDSL